MKTLTAEIFAVGKWNDTEVTLDTLNELANNFSRLAEFVDVPLKFGHNDEQPITDGQPALGWVDRVWVEGEKLLANFTDIPKVVYDAIKAKRYKNVSIEALFDVEHGGTRYGTVLTAVALLGVDMPAVNTLKDLTTYMTAKNLAFSSHATFSKKPFNHSEDSNMDLKEAQAKIEFLEAELEAKDKIIAGHAAEKATFSVEKAELEGKVKTLETEKEASTFAREKEDVTKDLEQLVKDGKILPAQRDDLLKEFTVENKASVLFTIKTLKGNATKVPGTGSSAKEDGDDNSQEGLAVDEKIAIKAREYAAEHKVSFSAATSAILANDPKLAREYADMNDGGDA